MATQPTQNAVPSESPRDLKFNAGKIDEFVTSLALQYIDRFGQAHYTIEGLRHLAQQAISAFGWIPLDSFQEGATITLPNQVLRDEATGEYYRWDGAFPKSVSAGSTPDSAGGVGLGAWVSVGDAALRSMLATSAGSSMIGYAGGEEPSNKSDDSTVQGALNRLNERVVYAHKYGVKADGLTDDTTALKNLSRAISAMTSPVVRVVFPQGSSLVGSQQQAPNATSGYSFRPSYYASEGNQGWFYVSGRSGKTVIDAYGYTIKLNDGMKHGAFNPATGAAHPSPTTGFKDVNYQAWVGHCAAFKGNESILVLGLKADGNARGAQWGGNWGDSGWQCSGFGIWDTGNKAFRAIAVESTDCVLDSLYSSVESGWTPALNGAQRSTNLFQCRFSNSRRQGWTIAGGQNFKATQCQFLSIGRKAANAGNNYSAPEACIDVETESGPAYDIVIEDCQLIDGGLSTFLAASFINSFSRATLNRCLLRTNSTIAQMYVTGSGVELNKCLIEGSGFEFRNASQTEPSLKGCIIRNHINGVVADFCNYAGNVGVMEDNYFDIIFASNMGSRQLFALSGGDITATPTYPQKGTFRFNRINLSGNQDSVTAAANGRTYLGYIQFFFDMDMRITATGMSGARLVDINVAGSNVNQRGVTVDTNKVVDRDSGTSSLMSAGGYMIGRVMEIAASALVPSVSGMSIGSDSRRLGNLYIGQNGIYMIDAGGTKRLITINAAGSLVISAA